MDFYRGAAVAAILSLSTPVAANAAAAAESDCWGAEESSAARIQNLHVLLMIESVRCEKTMPSVMNNYRAFVDAKQAVLDSSKYVVQAHFVKQQGPKAGIEAYTNYETRLGNALSVPKAGYMRCKNIGALAGLAASASKADLVALSNTIATNSLIKDCPAVASAKDKAMVIPVWEQSDPAADQKAVASSTPVAETAAPKPDESLGTDEAAKSPAKAAAVAEAKANTASTATSGSGDAATALAQAAKALGQAATALKASSAEPEAQTE